MHAAESAGESANLMVDEEGVYIYINGRLQQKEAFEIPDGKNIIYFDNILCPFCKIFNVVWSMLVEDRELSGYTFMRVVCKYFEGECNHPESKRAFGRFGVKRSPLVMVVLKENGRIVFTKEIPPSRYNYDYLRIKRAILKAFEEEAKSLPTSALNDSGKPLQQPRAQDQCRGQY